MHQRDIKLEIVRLRKDEGLTYGEIKRKFPYVAKGTLSGWLRNIILSTSHQRRILDKKLKGREGLIIHNRQKREQSLFEAKKYTAQGARYIKKLTRKDLLVAGTALYWAEGYKKNKNTIEFVNSDPKVIQIIMRFFREIISVKEEKFRCGLILHPGLNSEEAIQFWSTLTKVPRNQFIKTRIKPPKTSTGKMHNILYKGTLRIYICDTRQRMILQGFMDRLFQLFDNNMPPSSSLV